MKNTMFAAALAASALIPVAAQAQAIPAAVIAVVDLDKVTSECNACKSAQAALKSQAQSLQSREEALAAPLKSEGSALQQSVAALGGKTPDAALQAKIKAFQAKQQAAAAEVEKKQGDLQRNQQYIQQQILAKLGPVYQQVMQRRGANLMLESGSTLAATNAVDVTADVTAGLNAALPSIAATAPAQATQSR